jgi:arsenate reductase (thioredoxin)
MQKPINVLFLCTHNSARSVMAEALLAKLGNGRFLAFSAGSFPKSAPNRFALEQIATLGADVAQYASKSWNVYTGTDAPKMDIIITVCDNAAGEVCPIWPGYPTSAHWGFSDPSETDGDETMRRAAFANTFVEIRRHVECLVRLSDAELATPREPLAAIHRSLTSM